MKILVTGAKGFVGRNLVENLKNIRDNKNKTRPQLKITEIFEYDKDSSLDELEEYCKQADFVFNLAGVNRPQNIEEFQDNNFGFASQLLENLKRFKNTCPVMLSSSIQASLSGRFGVTDYGLSKKAGEDLFFEYGEETGAKVYVYRFPNLVGKWGRPNYNSAVATFCHNIANNIPIVLNDSSVILDMVFVEDVVEEMFEILEGRVKRCEFEGVEPIPSSTGKYCYVPTIYQASLSEIVDLLKKFHQQPRTLFIPPIPEGSFEKKLYSMYLSYLPHNKISFDLKMNHDDRGSFTEILRTLDHGQVSVNISKPGITKGQHWHNTKWEMFIVVSGRGLIQERRIGTDELIEFEVSGEKLQVVQMLPGYTHNIINLSDTENLVTVMWANEIFDEDKPDTYFEPVVKE